MTILTAPERETVAKVSDRYGRPIRSLRLSVTQRCDLSCDYCHKEGQRASDVEMTPTEIARLVRIASTLGVRKVKITGGEPLMREDITDVISGISRLASEVSLTTNGHHLDEIAPRLKSAGLKRINVSLHTLKDDVYESICGTHLSASVVDGIGRAVTVGLNPVKVNMVVLKGYNENEIESMMDFCARAGAVLQLIEYETHRDGVQDERFKSRFYSLEQVEEDLRKRAANMTYNELHRRRQYLVRASEGQVRVEFVRPMHNTVFCENCTRIRLSSDGRVKPCLLEHSGEEDVLGPMRSGAGDAELRQIFLKVVSARRPYWS